MDNLKTTLEMAVTEASMTPEQVALYKRAYRLGRKDGKKGGNRKKLKKMRQRVEKEKKRSDKLHDRCEKLVMKNEQLKAENMAMRRMICKAMNHGLQGAFGKKAEDLYLPTFEDLGGKMYEC